MEKRELQEIALHILKSIGIEATEDCIDRESIVGNTGETKPVLVHGTKVSAKVVNYGNGGFRVEVYFSLPEGACMANTYINHCVVKENIPVGGWNRRPYAGRKTNGPGGKGTEAYSPWNNRFFCVDSMGYEDVEFDQAVENTITLARPFIKHLADIPSLRYWYPEDEEVIAKAREIVAGADFHETDVDREDRAHWMEDNNSFFKGWFYPFDRSGKGQFDTALYGPEFVAKQRGIEGSFEYAVTLLLVEDDEYIHKARKACCIREVRETRIIRY